METRFRQGVFDSVTRRMLIDATHPEETRVAVVKDTKLEEFDYETEFRKQLKGNIYLAKVTRVEPSLQAAFVEYGGNRHAFLPFPEIHADYYRIPVGDRPHSDEDEGEGSHSAEAALPLDDEAIHNVFSFGGSVMPLRHDEDDSVSESLPHGDPADHEPETQAAADGPFHDEAFHDEASHDEEGEFHEESYVAPTEHDHRAHDDVDGNEHTDDSGYADEGERSESGHSDGDRTDGGHPQADHAEGEPARAEGQQGSTVETVGGDEVEEMRHRRRSSMPRYKIQEVIKRRQIMLIQVSKEERGNKGAAITTFLSLPGRYCVLMPNTPRGGGVSRKIANPQDRKRLKELMSDLELPDGMSVILRTAGVERSKAEIKRDLDYLLRLWEAIRDLTLRSTAPALVYEEGNLIKRSIRDIYSRDIDEILVAGEEGHRQARDFMRMLMPSHVKRVQLYRDHVPLFFRFQVESQIDAIVNPVAQLRSGGYIVINQTEALVAIDVNSGRSTRERNIEETAYKTNLEAADEIARQLRLRDMGGLIVVDFIDMEDPRHDSAVERRLKDAMKIDRARIQIGRMSAFGLLELSRQRLHPSLIESNFHTCAACRGTGIVRSMESAAFVALRAIEEEGIKARAAEIDLFVSGPIALYVLNQKRSALTDIESRYSFRVSIHADDNLISPDFRIERVRAHPPGFAPPVTMQALPAPVVDPDDDLEDEDETAGGGEISEDEKNGGERGVRRRRRRRGRRRGQFGEGEGEGELAAGEGTEGGEEYSSSEAQEETATASETGDQPDFSYPAEPAAGNGDKTAERAGRRRRGRRGGQRRNRPEGEGESASNGPEREMHSGSAFGSGLDDVESGDAESGEAETGIAYDEDGVDSVSEPLPHAKDQPEEDHAGPAPDSEPEHEFGPVPAGQAEPALSEPREKSQFREESESRGEDESTTTTHEQAPPRVASAYETVNQSPDTPRQGWWKRLIQ